MCQGLPRLRRQETRLKAYQQVYLLRAILFIGSSAIKIRVCFQIDDMPNSRAAGNDPLFGHVGRLQTGSGTCEYYSSRRPSRARISVASSANSRCPPTGIP